MPLASLMTVATVVQPPASECSIVTIPDWPPGVLPQTSICPPSVVPTSGNTNPCAYGFGLPSTNRSPLWLNSDIGASSTVNQSTSETPLSHISCRASGTQRSSTASGTP